MEQCKDCINRDLRDELLCCQCAKLCNEWNELKKQLPIIRKFTKDYVCGYYQANERAESEKVR